MDEQVSDSVIASTVRLRLADDEELRSSALDVTVSGGIVTLTGRVPRRTLRQRAERLAREVEGVREVKNLIRVHGPSN